ncbi:MAG: xylulokinase, partial [Planctomycetes bacterium]|nr:xylulokinase [Planctomycetota bacterium]
LASTALLGELTTAAAEALGLKSGVPVIVGGADGMCAGIGAGSVSHGNTYNCLGSSAWIATTTSMPIIDVQHRIHTFAHAVPGMYHPMGTMLVGGGVYAWLKRTMCLYETMAAQEEGISPYELMNEAAAESPPGAHGLIFLPHLLGERTPRWDPLARAGFIGLDMTHSRGDLIRAVLEGVVLNLAITVDIYREMGVEVDKMLVIGGGAKGDLWRQIMSDIYDVELLRPNYLEEATSIGAAILAGIGAGVYADFSVVDRFITIVDRIVPDPANRIMYDEKKKLFDQVYKALEPLLPALAKAREWE